MSRRSGQEVDANAKRVFVGIPTINRPLLVRETIASVVAQTYAEIRVVVSDNRSDPTVIESVRRYIEGLDDARISFVVQPNNDGEYGQGRYFMAESAGYEYFMILHDDDVLKECYIETALDALEQNREVSAFLADPYVFGEDGNISDTATREYLADHGRLKARTGKIDVLSAYVLSGFLPISGTVFRRTALEDSGFVDDTVTGNFPFECDVFLRLGHAGASAWYQGEELIGFRFHRSSMRNYMKLMENRDVVDRMLKLFSNYRYEGKVERRRRAIVSRLLRSRALIELRESKSAAARASLIAALKSNVFSMKSWAIAPFVLMVPRLFSSLLPGPSTQQDAPVYVATREE